MKRTPHYKLWYNLLYEVCCKPQPTQPTSHHADLTAADKKRKVLKEPAALTSAAPNVVLARAGPGRGTRDKIGLTKPQAAKSARRVVTATRGVGAVVVPTALAEEPDVPPADHVLNHAYALPPDAQRCPPSMDGLVKIGTSAELTELLSTSSHRFVVLFESSPGIPMVSCG